MLLLLEPSAAQQQALTAELANQQNTASPEYHHWLTPAAFAAAYANSSSDVAAVVAWLQSQGFQVAQLPSGLGWIEFSGTVAQVEQAFHTQIASVTTGSETRFYLTDGISVPSALRPVIHGLASLDGALSAPAVTTPRPVSASAAELAAETSLSQAEALTPQLAAQLLHLDALQSAGINGAGETIAIAARSNVLSQDVAAFRSAFSLPASPLTVILNGPDPGLASRAGDQAEAVMAASWAGAAAPGAQIVLVPAASTTATDGVDLSLAAIVDQALAHTVAVGYSTCEAALSESHQAFYAALYQQAAAQGMAVIAASGDSGAAACQAAGSNVRVTTGYGVNALASTPWNTAVGVAAFGLSGRSADLSALAGWSPVNGADPAYAGGGGGSTLYREPNWQPVPAQNQQSSASTGVYYRLLPDIALPAAMDSGVNPGLAFCLSGSEAASGCTLVRAGGSSAATALFAGVGALLAEKYGAQGNLAPNLYTMSRISGIFSDLQQGSAQLPCAPGTSGCGATEQIGYDATTGYDMATGLGAVNAQALVDRWSARPQAGHNTVTVTMAVTPTELNSTYNPSALVTLTATVTDPTSGGTPSGSVTFLNQSTGLALSGTSAANLTSSGNSSATASISLQLNSVFSSTGSYNIEASYVGDTTYENLISSPVTVTTEKSCSSIGVVPSTSNPAPGATISVTATLVVSTLCGPPAGNASPTGLVTLDLDGLPQSPQVALSTTGGVTSATFSLVVPANSTLGSHSLQAVYAGDSSYAAETSGSTTISVSKGSTTTALTFTGTPTLGALSTSWTFTATVTPSATTPALSGTVSFYDGSTLLGTAVPVSTTSAGDIATLTVALTNSASHTVIAVYSGDSNWTGSTSNTVLLAATTLPDYVILTSNFSLTNPAPPGQSVILVATVTPYTVPTATEEQNPSGMVVFYNGTTVIGEVALVATPLSDSSTATLATTNLSGGQDSITAVYLGDLYFSEGTSNTLGIDVEDFTITPASSNPPEALTIVQGSAGSASFVITGLGGFNNQIQVVCAVATQDDMTCTASPQQVVPTATVTFVVQTFGAGQAVVSANRRPPPLWPRAAGGSALAVLAFFLLPFGRRARIFADRQARGARRFLILLLLLAGLGAAGIGCNSVTLLSSSGTPLGQTTLQITATDYVNNAVVSRSVFLTVNVVAKTN
jgi:subtilase family serine protease